MIGSSLSHFKITAKLGEGGMGEVYRAEDSKLGREVAIKVLPEAVASDPERLARFEREAKVVASLNHPNIAAIYSIETAETIEAAGLGAGRPDDVKVTFLVMELVEGQDLHEKLASGSIPIEQTLPIASQMAQALEAAHERGIIHRDLKPANVRVTSEGQVKVLDFGLAKALDPTAGTETGRFNSEGGATPAPAALSLSPTLTQQMTSAGIILGTAAYMSPEQAKGEVVDKRADIWSFGLVVFEMLTGQKLFAADSVAETLAGVIKTEIDFNQLPSDVPISIIRLLRRCLVRDAKNRLHDIADARIVIEDVRAGRVEEPQLAEAATSTPPKKAMVVIPYLVAALGMLVGLLSIWQPWASDTRSDDRGSAYQFAIQAPEDTLMASGLDLSPDGRRIAFVAKGADGHRELWVRDVDTLEAYKLPGTKGARYPFWAPDSRQIGFFAESRLKVTDLIGTTPVTLATVGAPTFERGACWGADNIIVFAPTFTGGLSRVSAGGGDVEEATKIPSGGDFGTHRFPSFFPDGRQFVFFAAAGSGVEPGTLMIGELGSLESKRLGPSQSRAIFGDPDFLLYVRGESLVAHRIDLESLEFRGEPEVLGISLSGSISVSGHRSLAAAGGTLLHRNDTRNDTRLVWSDRAGRDLGEIGAGRKAWQYAPRISPDGRYVAAGTFEPQAPNGDLWIHDLERNIASPFQAGEGDEQVPAWSPTGDRIAYESIRSGAVYLVFVGSVVHPDQRRVVHESTTNPAVEFWTTDGQTLVFSKPEESGETGMWVLSLEEGSEPIPLFPGPGSQGAASLSPDGNWVAYSSDETRRLEVYVRSFDGQGSAQRVSSGGGGQPLWRGDGQELFYVNSVGEIVAVPVTPGDPPTFGAEEVLFNARLEEALDRQYDASPDGQRFVLNRQAVEGAEPAVVTTNWQRLIKP